ncbi:MAG: hypothetical protein IPK87_09400 [Planctomycetes bacterium]|nr:hypothetical protein [Planctomycetota bacterium]
MVVPALLLCACATGPELPPPAAGTGHVVVGMRLIEKTVDDTNVSDEYAVRRERHITGKTLPDMVVVLEGNSGGSATPDKAEITLTPEGFSRRQLLLKAGGSLTIANKREDAVSIFGFSREGHEVAVMLEPGASSTVPVPNAGAYEMVTEADNSAYAVLHVVDSGAAWIGPSDQYAVFRDVKPGTYRAVVYQARAEGWSKEVTVAANGREDLKAELKVAKRR